VVSRIISRVRRLKQLVSEREATRFHPSLYAVQIAQVWTEPVLHFLRLSTRWRQPDSLPFLQIMVSFSVVGAIATAMILARR
jgi:hypothetical protein